jgi:hypothetical protein
MRGAELQEKVKSQKAKVVGTSCLHPTPNRIDLGLEFEPVYQSLLQAMLTLARSAAPRGKSAGASQKSKCKSQRVKVENSVFD